MSEYDNILSQMEQEYMNKSGCMPDEASDIGIRLKVLAKELALLSEKIDEVKVQTLPQTATGKFLDLHAKQKGLERKNGTAAEGNIIFTRDTPASGDIVIPKGTIVLTSGEYPIEFETTEENVLKKGEVSVCCKGICKSFGKIGNVAKNIISSLATPINGILYVGNQIFTGGTEAETDDELRKRLLLSYKLVSNGTNSGFYNEFALKYDGINFANVIPRKNGVGTVHISLGSKNKKDGVSQSVIEKFLNDINEFKEINVTVTADNAKVVNKDISCEIMPSEGYSQQETIELTKEKIKEYINNLKIGEPLFISAMLKEIMSCKGIKNAKIIIPNDDVRVLEEQIIDAGNIIVNTMAVV